MKRFLSILILLCAVRGYGAVTIKQVNAEASGWILNQTVGSNDTNGGFAFGFGAYNSGPGAIALNVTSPGFDDVAATNTIARTLSATKQLRLPYPNNALNDCTASGADAAIRTATSDYVFSGDLVAMTSIANWYSNNVPATNGMTVVNNSTAAHPKCVANWSRPGWQKISANTMTLGAVGFHRSGQSGRPLRVMRFVARDQHSHAVTNFVTAAPIDWTMGDPVPVCEYVASMDISTFTQGDLIRCDFTAYPWVGDSGAVLDTFDNVNSQPTPLYAAITNLCDRSGTYGGAVAVVATNGNNSLGRCYSNSVGYAGVPSSNYFATVALAVTAITASNNAWYGHNDCGGGLVYLEGGTNYTYSGTGGTFTGTPGTWLTVQASPGHGTNDVIIIGRSGVADFGNAKIRLKNLNIASADALTFYNAPYYWIDGNLVNVSSVSVWDVNTIEYWTWNNIIQLPSGVAPTGNQVESPALVRGNLLNHNPGSDLVFCYTVIGNLRTATNVLSNSLFVTEQSGQKVPNPTGFILAFNKTTMNGQVTTFQTILNSNNAFGCAIVQNAFESLTATQTQPICAINAQATFIDPSYNFIIWNNTFTGGRLNAAYDEVGTSPNHSHFWSIRKTILSESFNIKSDTFGTPSGNRIGNWPVLYGVGMADNVIGLVTNFTAAGQFLCEWPGLNTLGTNQVSTSTLSPLGYFKFTSTGAFDGTTGGNGGGNYRLLSSSPAIVSSSAWYGLPYDIEGNNRGGFDPPGAYASASPRKGGGFFAQ